MSGELQVTIWTASQTQRSSINDEIIEADKIAESYNKVKSADVLLSLSRKTEDKINNTGRAHLVKNRFGPDGVTFPVRMDTSKGIVKIYDPNSPEGDKLKETRTLIVVEHDMGFVKEISDVISVMHQGKLLAEGKAQTIEKDAKVKEAYLGKKGITNA